MKFLIPVIINFGLFFSALAEPNDLRALMFYENDQSSVFSNADFFGGDEQSLKSQIEFHRSVFKDPALAKTWACRFPLRYEAFRKDKGVVSIDLETCNDLNAFVHQFGRSVFLTYASPLLSAPSSAFGHVFLTFSQDDSPTLASPVVSFVATVTGKSSPFSYLKNGLSGGFEGSMISEPLYKKLNEYNRIEQRTLHYFKLDLSRTEQQRLIYSLFELRDAKFAYYFFTLNCGSLVDHALRIAEGTKSNYSLYVIPENVLKSHFNRVVAAYASAPLFERVNRNFDQLDSSEQERVRLLLKDEKAPEPRSSHNTSRFLREYYEYEFRARRNILPYFTEVSELAFQEYPRIEPNALPQLNKDRSERLSLKAIHYFKSDTAYHFQFRPVLRDFYDSPDLQNSKIIFSLMNIELGLNGGKDFQLETFDLFKIYSLGVKGSFLSLPAWQISVGLNRVNPLSTLTPEIQGGYGVSFVSTRSVTSAFLLKAGVVTSVSGLNLFGGGQLTSMVDFNSHLILVQDSEARFYLNQPLFITRLSSVFSKGRFSFQIGPEFETSRRGSSWVASVSGRW